MNEIIFVGIGGFSGAISRYLSILFVTNIAGGKNYPIGTMAVNILGCFLLGLGLGIATEKQILSPEVRLLLFTGFLGSFTTYSTFGAESFGLIKDGSFISASVNIILHIIVGLAAVWAGDLVSKAV